MNQPLVAIIEDDFDARNSVAMLLKAYDLNSVEFSSAEAFLRDADIDHCHCLLVDLQLPGISGVDLLQELNERELKIPFILVTGASGLGLEIAKSHGAFAVLEKPVEPLQMIDCILEAVQPKKSRPST